MIDIGTGPALVLIPGIQGRWEWMNPAVTALSKEFRVVSSSLPGEPGCGAPVSPGDGFDAFVGYVDGLLDARQIPTAVICGLSFGGLIALRYAAQRPERVRALILVSTPGPHWKPTPRQQADIDRPLLRSPLFAIGAARRSWGELRVTYPNLVERIRFCAKAAPRVIRAPAVPWRMGVRARMAAAERFDRDCARITVPTLVVTGERDLDRVVGPDDSMNYVTAIQGARYQLFENTGHLGTISAPERFAMIVSRFLNG
jgi:pimeloyl-ACP methyl ester carboxylesterase